jgi:hypothetical protein
MTPTARPPSLWRTQAAGWGAKLRLPFVVFGGMLALQSSADLDATKLIYLAGTAICLAGALVSAWRQRGTYEARQLAPWFLGSAALVAMLVVSFPISSANGTPAMAWLRDAATYGLFAAVPVFALDAHLTLSRRALLTILVIAGLAGGLSWAVEWLARRDIVELPLSRILLPTGQLPTALYVFASAAALSSRRFASWAVLAGVVLGLFLVTGTRSSLILLAGPLAMVVAAGWQRAMAAFRPLALHAFVAVFVVVVFQVSLSAAAADPLPDDGGGSPAPGPAETSGPDVIGDRFGSLPDLLGSPASDASIRERAAQYQAAWSLFVRSPVWGVGPGHPIEWIDVSGIRRDEFTADTPMVLPAKFGGIGVAVFAVIAYAFVSVAIAAFRRAGPSRVPLSLIGYGSVAAVGLPLGFLPEDKGASMALMILVALSLVETRKPPPTG